MTRIESLFTLLVILVTAGCSFPNAQSPSIEVLTQPSATSSFAELSQSEPGQPELQSVQLDVAVAPIPAPTETSEALQDEQPTATATYTTPAVAALNPLTGQPCQDLALLNLPPALVSVSNFPVTARPQAGLSFSPYVFEIYIGEGMTRFLALFYCSFPPETVSGDNTIGPIRSGRLPYESLRKLYNGFLIMASASGEVSTQLGGSTNVFGSDAGDINSALIDVSKLKGIAERQTYTEPPNLSGNLFKPEPPQDSLDASKLWVFYNYYNQVMWTYDAAKGAYLRAQDKADGSGAFLQSTDRLTGEPLAFENVIVFYAEHEVLNSEGTLIDVNLLYTLGKAYLFRDGQMVPVRWSTMNEEYEKTTGKLRPLRFVDAQGKPVPLKPGSVWVEFVHLSTALSEVEPGMWKARFYAP
jgi:hypothetical protein